MTAKKKTAHKQTKIQNILDFLYFKPILGFAQKITLIGLLLFFCFITIGICQASGEKNISIDKHNVSAGTPITLSSLNIRPADIDSCIWYVEEREVSHSSELTPYTPSIEDQEHFIRVSVTLKDGSVYNDSIYFSTLPVIYLESETSYTDITKEEDASVFLDLTAGPEYPSYQLYTGAAKIHLRGNTTSAYPKRPFKLKLEEKSNLLNLGETKHWVLLANIIDSTLLRNKLAYDFSGDIGAPCQMNSELVTLIYNGEYQGIYQLCEQVRIGTNSVNIFNWEDAAKETAETLTFDLVRERQILPEEQQTIQELIEQDLLADLSWLETYHFESPSLKALNENQCSELPVSYNLKNILDFYTLPKASGGVLLEMDFYHQADACLETNYFLPIYFSKPANGDSFPELYSYIHEYLQVFEYALHDTDFTYHNSSPHFRMNDIGGFDWEAVTWTGITYEPADFYSADWDSAHYSEVVDFESLMTNFLLCEFTVNWDSMKNSVYLYKDIEGPFYLAPAWDYDWAWGNSCYGIPTWDPEIWFTTEPFFSSEQYYQNVQWNRYLIRDPYFLANVYEKYWEIRESVMEELICEDGLIDQYAERLSLPAAANDAKWGGSIGTFEGQKFDEGIASLKDFIQQRITWLDQQFSSIETLRRSLGYYITSDTLWTEADTHLQEKNEGILVTVHTASDDYAGISFQVNGTHFYNAAVIDHTASLWIPDCDLRPEPGAWNVVQVRALDEDDHYIVNPEGTVPGDYTNAISNYICFQTEAS